MKPLDFDIFPQSTFWDDVSNKFDDLTESTKDFFKDAFGRRLEDSSFQVYTRASDNGIDVVAIGRNSGVELSTTSSSHIFMIFLLLPKLLFN